jgi:hypothetical protein
MCKLKNVFLLSVILFTFSVLLQANTPPVLQISDGSNIATIDNTGTVSFSGACTPATCTTTTVTAGPGVVRWGGTIGSFSLILAIGVSFGPSTPTLDLAIEDLTTTADGSITFKWTDTNFNTPTTGSTFTANGTLTGGGSATFSAFLDNNNIEFGTGIPVATVALNAPQVTGPGTTTTPYSMTEVAVITLSAGSGLSVDVLFLGLPTTIPSTPVAPGDTATIGFWHNKNGQAVINSFNGSPSSTALGNWLASNFPNLFGSFAGQTNAQVAADYMTAFGNVGGVQGNTYVQVFATALAVYATTSSLGGQSLVASGLAAKYGFVVSVGGTGNATFNIGNNGAAAGVPNGTTLTVLQLLHIANVNFNPTTGLFYGGDPVLTSDLNNIFNGINQAGDIA